MTASSPEGRSNRVPAASWIIGASEGCDIRVASPYVSGRHCRLVREGDDWVLEDLGSTNGTFINGVPLRGRGRVSRTDRITLGQSTPLPWPLESSRSVPAAHTAPEPRHLPLPGVGETSVIGRSSDCDIRLDFPMVSSRHASIQHTPDGWIVRDLGSTNGTFVGNQRIATSTRVGPGDVIGLGSYRLKLAFDERSLEEEDRSCDAGVEVAGVSVHVQGRQILADISFVVRPGELIGVMGASGAGKSTLLAAIVGEQATSKGRIAIAGIDVQSHRDQLRGQIGHVPQDDIMHTELSVEHALWYSARLRLPADFGDEEIETRIASVTDQLGISAVAAERIGSAARRGISGGQRKRVNVAMEMVTDPPILVLDEPTSGLSSVDALTLIQQLRKLADAGKTIVLTMHQPSGDMLRLFSAVALLARDDSTGGVGRLAWYGPATDATAFFGSESAGGPPGPDADVMLRGLDRRPGAQWIKEFRSSATYRDWVTDRLSGDATPAGPSDARTPKLLELVRQCGVLVRRMLAVKISDRSSSMLLVAQAPAIALLVAGAFGAKARAALTLESWGSLSNAVAMTTFLLALAAVWFGCANAARELVDERAIYRRERMVGLSPAAYLGSKVIVLGMICAVQCAILLAVGGWGCGLAGSASYAFGVMMLAAGVGTVIGLGVSAVAATPEAAAAVLPVVVLPLVVLGGVLVPVADLSYPLGVLADLMPSRWAFEALLGNEADTRALLQYPDPAKPWVQRFRDLAEPWFPREGWRSSAWRPMLMLATMWLLGLAGVYSRLVRQPK